MNPKEIEKIFKKSRNIYFVGIKGAAVSGLAQILKKKGYRVTGSDTHEHFFTDKLLKKAKIKFYEGFDAEHITQDIDVVISSNAYLMGTITNPEIQEIKKRGIPLLSYPEALSYFFNKSYGVAIAGTHGKTTVTAVVAYILHKAGKKPNALIGAQIANTKSNVMVGESDIFVLEADEYKEAFLEYRPNVIAILNTDWDHPDYFKTKSAYRKSFEKFEKNLKRGGEIFVERDLKIRKNKYVTLLIGDHNQYNLNAAAKICEHLGIRRSVIKKAIMEFRGTNRRLEIVGKWHSNIVIDDYGHNPQKVAAGLKALKSHYQNNPTSRKAPKGKRKIIVVFQPHTYSRTEQFLKDFAKSLIIANKIYLLDIYASAREAKGTVTSEDLIKEIKKLGKDAKNLKTVSAAQKYFIKYPPKNSVIVAMGAGDVGDLASHLVR